MRRINAVVVSSTIPRKFDEAGLAQSVFIPFQWYIDLISSVDENKLLSYSLTDAAPVSWISLFHSVLRGFGLVLNGSATRIYNTKRNFVITWTAYKNIQPVTKLNFVKTKFNFSYIAMKTATLQSPNFLIQKHQILQGGARPSPGILGRIIQVKGKLDEPSSFIDLIGTYV